MILVQPILFNAVDVFVNVGAQRRCVVVVFNLLIQLQSLACFALLLVDVTCLQQVEGAEAVVVGHLGSLYKCFCCGIGIACLTALHFGCPVVFAKKTKTNNIYADVYTAEVYSYTHQRSYDIVVSKDFLSPGDRVLVIDDFLAKGSALNALLKLIRDAGATPVGAGIVIEKAFQNGGKDLRDSGFRVESLARIGAMSQAEGIQFV